MSSVTKFLLRVIAFLTVVHYTPVEAVEVKAETLQTGKILEAGEIDSSTVEVGAFVVVIHGKGERHPVSGEWERLATARGYIHAVDADVLFLIQGKDLGPQQIALQCIQKLVLIDPGRVISGAKEKLTPRSADGDSLESHSPKSVETEAAADFSSPAKRLTLKLGAGIAYGFTGALAGAILGASSFHYLSGAHNCSGDQSCGLAAAYGGLTGLVTGYSIGSAIGVSSVDPNDRFFACLAGSLVGIGFGSLMLSKDWSHGFWGTSPLFLWSPVLATIASEMSRKPPESHRFSIGLAPGSRGSFFASAALRF